MNEIVRKIGSLAVGDTPLIYLEKYDIYAKVERNNPSGSVKDRPAYFMILKAINEGKIDENTIIVEPTSGNTGIALAWVGAQLGLKVVLTMPESVSVERRQVLKGFGADLILVENMRKAVEKAVEIVQTKGAFMPNQFENPNNPIAHELTTAPEILRQMNYTLGGFVAGVGTGGTITGVGRVLRRFLGESVKIVALEPKQSAVLSGNLAGPHRIQGIGSGFVPGNFDKSIVDEILQIDDEDSVRMMEKLWNEGTFVGVSSAANLLGAIQVKERYNISRVVTVFPDDGFKYLSNAQ